jgi:hypothetical protein
MYLIVLPHVLGKVGPLPGRVHGVSFSQKSGFEV